MNKNKNDNINDILIIKLGALGDVINTLPAVIRIKKYFSARIHWLVAPLSVPLISDHPAVDHVIIFDIKNIKESFFYVRNEIRKITFDISIDFQRTLKSGLFCTMSKTRRRIGFDRKRCKEMTWLFPFERIPVSVPQKHMLLQYLEFSDYLGAVGDDISWGLSYSNMNRFNIPGKYIVLNTGATKKANLWNPEGFASLATYVKSKYELTSVLTGGKEDIDFARKISVLSGHAVFNLVGKTSIRDLKDVIGNSELIVSCDTGPMHLAVALNKNIIALFGPSNPQRTGPFKGEVIQKEFDCLPCNKNKCSNPVCMKAITYEDVTNRIDKLLLTKS
jgi:ADP-heptose:LPS heptosyltransferase